MRSEGDISLPLNVTNETAHHKVCGLSWVTVSWHSCWVFSRLLSCRFEYHELECCLVPAYSKEGRHLCYRYPQNLAETTSPDGHRIRWSTPLTVHLLSRITFQPTLQPMSMLTTSHKPLFSKRQTNMWGSRLSPATFWRLRFDLGSQFKDLKGAVFSFLTRISNHHCGSIHQLLL